MSDFSSGGFESGASGPSFGGYDGGGFDYTSAEGFTADSGVDFTASDTSYDTFPEDWTLGADVPDYFPDDWTAGRLEEQFEVPDYVPEYWLETDGDRERALGELALLEPDGGGPASLIEAEPSPAEEELAELQFGEASQTVYEAMPEAFDGGGDLPPIEGDDGDGWGGGDGDDDPQIAVMMRREKIKRFFRIEWDETYQCYHLSWAAPDNSPLPEELALDLENIFQYSSGWEAERNTYEVTVWAAKGSEVQRDDTEVTDMAMKVIEGHYWENRVIRSYQSW